jgi:hypothetical protein
VAPGPFGFVQFEFGFLLGPGDGRFLVRSGPTEDPEAVLVLATLGSVERRLLKGRKGAIVTESAAEPVPTNRATVVRVDAFASDTDAAAWLAAVRTDADRREDELDRALRVLNRAIHAHRVSCGDGHPRDVSTDQALVTRIGFGAGDEVADGRYAEAWELPRGGRLLKRTMEAPEERFAALMGSREAVLACEELVLRTRMDLDAGRRREAALQARVALEALLAELPAGHGDRRDELEADRAAIGSAANAALRGPLSDELIDALAASVGRMESALKARRLDSVSPPRT